MLACAVIHSLHDKASGSFETLTCLRSFCLLQQASARLLRVCCSLVALSRRDPLREAAYKVAQPSVSLSHSWGTSKCCHWSCCVHVLPDLSRYLYIRFHRASKTPRASIRLSRLTLGTMAVISASLKWVSGCTTGFDTGLLQLPKSRWSAAQSLCFMLFEQALAEAGYVTEEAEQADVYYVPAWLYTLAHQTYIRAEVPIGTRCYSGPNRSHSTASNQICPVQPFAPSVIHS